MRGKRLFFQGTPRIGKSTLLRRELARQSPMLAGLSVQRVWEGDRIAGYQALTVWGRELPPVDVPYSADLPGVFLRGKEEKLSVLEQVIREVEELSHCPECDLVVLDEIGGVELAFPGIVDPLRWILSGTKPCIGIWKARENRRRTLSNLPLEDFDRKYDQLERLILERGAIHTVTVDQMEWMEEQISIFLTEEMEKRTSGDGI